MEKTTVYLPATLKAGLKRVAAARGVSEAHVIRAAIQEVVEKERPAPSFGLFASDEVQASRTDEYLEGFGEW